MIDLTELPDGVLAYIVQLRMEAARTRIQRNEARAERDALLADLSA